MSGDDLFSKKLSEVEDKKRGYISRRVEESDRERVNAEPVIPGSESSPGGEPEAAVDALTPGVPAFTGGSPRVTDKPPSTSESRLCTWIECSHDKRTWAEVREEEQNQNVDTRNGATLHSRPPSGCGGRSQSREGGGTITRPPSSPELCYERNSQWRYLALPSALGLRR